MQSLCIQLVLGPGVTFVGNSSTYNFSSIRHLVILENDYLSQNDAVFQNDYFDLFWEYKGRRYWISIIPSAAV